MTAAVAAMALRKVTRAAIMAGSSVGCLACLACLAGSRQATTPALTAIVPAPAALVGANSATAAAAPLAAAAQQGQLGVWPASGDNASKAPIRYHGTATDERVALKELNAVPPSGMLAAAVCSVQRWVSSSQAAGGGAQAQLLVAMACPACKPGARFTHGAQTAGLSLPAAPAPLCQGRWRSTRLNLTPLNHTPLVHPSNFTHVLPWALQKREKGLM